MGLFSNNIETMLITIVVIVGVFLLLREILCWYWKINQRVSLQKEQIELLKKIASALKTDKLDWEKDETSVAVGELQGELSVDALYAAIEKEEDNTDIVKRYIHKIAQKDEAQIEAFLKQYEQDKGKTLDQHLMNVMNDKKAVEDLLKPLNKNTEK